MWFNDYAIDPRDGSLTGFDLPLRPGMRIEDLPAQLRSEETTPASDSAQAAYHLFRISRDREGTLFQVDLRFEAGRSTQLGISLSPREYRNLDDTAFHASVEARIRLHRRWMHRATGIDSDPLIAAWGRMGVARDKSENVFVYLHWT